MNNLEIITLKKNSIVDFAKERNTLLENAKSKWIFFVDTDEVVSPKLQREIETVLESNTGNYSGFYIKRKIYLAGSYVGEDKVLRLAKKGSGRWVRSVHETWNIKGKVRTLKNYLIHNTADTLAEYIQKLNFYSDIHAKENLKEGKRSNVWKIIIYPKLKFLQNLLLGRGFVFSMLQSFHSFLAWSKQWELQKDYH